MEGKISQQIAKDLYKDYPSKALIKLNVLYSASSKHSHIRTNYPEIKSFLSRLVEKGGELN